MLFPCGREGLVCFQPSLDDDNTDIHAPTGFRTNQHRRHFELPETAREILKCPCFGMITTWRTKTVYTSTEKHIDPEEIALISTRPNTNRAHWLFNCPKLQCGCFWFKFSHGNGTLQNAAFRAICPSIVLAGGLPDGNWNGVRTAACWGCCLETAIGESHMWFSCAIHTRGERRSSWGWYFSLKVDTVMNFETSTVIIHSLASRSTGL
jgi:hypothetical protein